MLEKRKLAQEKTRNLNDKGAGGQKRKVKCAILSSSDENSKADNSDYMPNYEKVATIEFVQADKLSLRLYSLQFRQK